MNEAKEIIIFDTTLRDGEQAPGCSMTLGEKLKIAHALKELNVHCSWHYLIVYSLFQLP
jgi:2-isopropylmalate synthase